MACPANPGAATDVARHRISGLLFVGVVLSLFLQLPDAPVPSRAVPAVALAFLLALIGVAGFPLAERAGALRVLLTYFAVQLPLGAAVLLLGPAVNGELGAVFLLLLLAAQGARVLPLEWLVAVSAAIGAVLVAAALRLFPLVSTAERVRDAVGLLAALAVALGAGRLAANEQRARAEALRLAADLGAANRKLREYAAQAEELATVRERNRLAREIHDTLAQGYTGVLLQLEAVESALTASRNDVALERVGRAREIGRDGLAEARRSVWALRPRSLEEKPIAEVLRDAVLGLTAGTRLAARVEADDEPRPLPPAIEADLLRIAQEAVANAVKHADGRNLSVRLCHDGSAVELRVSDDGRGFVPGRSPTADGGGFGLTAMRERAERHGGTLHVRSAPGVGTEVVARLATSEGAPR